MWRTLAIWLLLLGLGGIGYEAFLDDGAADASSTLVNGQSTELREGPPYPPKK